MRLLLDTCAIIALAEGTLPPAAAAALETAERAVISAVVPWELGIKVKAGKLILPEPPLNWVRSLSVLYQLDPVIEALEAALLCSAAGLPLLHRDPFDRILVATALARNLTILTSDRIVPEYPGVETIW
jgi:PIN domain nuclease of toxin-antitoxin system